ncbi:uncharacterized protein LOC118800157 [Colossoma macropomum]|uniref:uncharacterized protein LOC118800157 n=1 Tax=Colossoma macropomum TaxID=42526 RepID=UPI00186500B2|nr:uncharacterized protein LOC118800157 [Colossoma macropomum]
MRKEHQMFLNEFEGFIHLLELNSKDDHHFIKTRGCEVERSSSGDATLLNTTDEYRLNGKVVLYLDVDKDQWMVLDNEFLPVKVMWDNEPHRNQVTKDYLQQRCMDRLLSYLNDNDSDSNEMSGLPNLGDYDDESEDSWMRSMPLYNYSDFKIMYCFSEVRHVRQVLSTKMFSLTIFIIIIIVIIFVLHRRRTVTTAKYLFTTGVITWVLLSFKKMIKAAKPPGKEASREDSNDVRDLCSVMVNEDQDGGDAEEPETEDEDDDGKNLDRWTTGLTTAGGQLSSRTASLPAFASERSESSDLTSTPALREEGDPLNLKVTAQQNI